MAIMVLPLLMATCGGGDLKGEIQQKWYLSAPIQTNGGQVCTGRAPVNGTWVTSYWFVSCHRWQEPTTTFYVAGDCVTATRANLVSTHSYYCG